MQNKAAKEHNNFYLLVLLLVQAFAATQMRPFSLEFATFFMAMHINKSC